MYTAFHFKSARRSRAILQMLKELKLEIPLPKIIQVERIIIYNSIPTTVIAITFQGDYVNPNNAG